MNNPFSVSSLGIGFGPKPMSAIGLLPLAANEGRSGYWRLFFMNMQEEALKANSEQPVNQKEKALEQVQGQEAPQRKSTSKKKVKKPRAVERDEYPNVIPFRRKPIYSDPTPVINVYEDLLTLKPLPSAMSFIEVKIASIREARIKRHQRNRRRAAALLLMAA